MKEIEFVYLTEHAFNVCEKPSPAINFLPEWFKNMPSYAPSEDDPRGKKIKVKNFESNATAKKCIPMRDSLSSGYIVPLWSDVIVERDKENNPTISWRVRDDVFQSHRNYGAPLVDSPIGYDSLVFKYVTNFRIKTPTGYSVLVKSPAGHEGLPFLPISAIIDSDKSVIDSNIPCWIRSDFEGIVERGTPIAQIIPFKRENWNSSFSWISGSQYEIENNRGFLSTIKNNYAKNIWSKKIYK